MYFETTLAVGFSTPIQLTCGVQAHTGELQRLVFQLHAAMNRMSANNWIPHARIRTRGSESKRSGQHKCEWKPVLHKHLVRKNSELPRHRLTRIRVIIKSAPRLPPIPP